MPVTDLSNINVPPAAAAWVDWAIYAFLGLFVVWVVLKAAGFALRRSYNLTPVATAGSRDLKPDFLAVDHEARKRLIERGREFDRVETRGLKQATRLAGFGVLVTGLASFMSATFVAFGRIEELDHTWRNITAKERFFAVIESHPVGFALALVLIVAAVYRMATTMRAVK